tara:strand:+ start:394 stop:594 length:201 start_codon:yes stop_codon:yes gene_type:complete
MKKLQIMYASDYEEFYYEDTNEVVPEGEPVGIEWDEVSSKNEFDTILKVNFDLLDNIYHQFKYEEE